MGLGGTGSKDVRMTDVFVPEHRVLDGVLVRDNTYSDRWRPDSPLYAMRFGVMFPFAISAGTFGIARGALNAAWEHIEARVSSQGSASKADPFVLAALARAAADVEASISHVQSIVAGFHDSVSSGGDITIKERLRFRVDQVRATDRAIESVNELYRLMGSSSIQKGSPLERYWRDLQVASIPAADVPDVLLHHLSEVHVVQHGIDANNNDKYDLAGLGVSTFAKNLGLGTVPEEATDPASCGVLTGAMAGVPPHGGVETGGGPGGRADLAMAGLGGLLVALSAVLLVRRTRRGA